MEDEEQKDYRVADRQVAPSFSESISPVNSTRAHTRVFRQTNWTQCTTSTPTSTRMEAWHVTSRNFARTPLTSLIELDEAEQQR